MVGFKTGKLTVLENFISKREGVYWECLCECGKKSYVNGVHLRNKNGTKSCVKCGIEGRLKHGHARGASGKRSPTLSVWKSMLDRCYNSKPGTQNFKHYKEKGIKVCERWHDFKNFLEDMGEKPENLSIDRINNNGDYEKSNCRWATQKEQVNNSSKMRWITYKDETLSLTDWSKRFNLNSGTLFYRIKKYGVDKAFEIIIKSWGPKQNPNT